MDLGLYLHRFDQGRAGAVATLLSGTDFCRRDVLYRVELFDCFNVYTLLSCEITSSLEQVLEVIASPAEYR